MKNIYLLIICFKIINSCWSSSNKCRKLTSESDCKKEKSCVWKSEEQPTECDCKNGIIICERFEFTSEIKDPSEPPYYRFLNECESSKIIINLTEMVCRSSNEKRLKLNIIFYFIICLFFIF